MPAGWLRSPSAAYGHHERAPPVSNSAERTRSQSQLIRGTDRNTLEGSEGQHPLVYRAEPHSVSAQTRRRAAGCPCQ
jgi:hypothetical protein